MKRFVSVALLLISLGIFGACGSQTNKLDKNTQQAENQVLDYVNDINKSIRDEESGSFYSDSLTEKDVQKIYLSKGDSEQYLFAVVEQLYYDPNLKNKSHKSDKHYLYRDNKIKQLSDTEFKQMIKDESNHFEKVYKND